MWLITGKNEATNMALYPKLRIKNNSVKKTWDIVAYSAQEVLTLSEHEGEEAATKAFKALVERLNGKGRR